MTSYEEKKALPPAEVLPGGVFPDDIAVIKKNARGENMSRLKIAIATGSVILVIFAVVGGTFLGLHLNRKPAVVTRSVKLAIQDEIVEETVAVDKERDTETFRTVSSTGTSFVIMDMKTRLSAYRFDGDQKCYILYESLEEAEDTVELLEDLEKMKEGEVDAAERRAETSLTVDEARGPVDQSVLSENMAEFCEGLQAYWAVRSDTEPTPTQQATTEEEEDEMEIEALPGTNGINAVQQRGVAQVVGALVCNWTTRNVCGRTCSKVCGKRRRRGLVEDAPEQEVKTRAKRGWIRRAVRRVVSAVCRSVCRWKCRAVRVKVCSAVG
ncbi:cartilage development [Branchiostoma belcheri]|nr:cartilage development [Branchiostoma belcheri]